MNYVVPPFFATNKRNNELVFATSHSSLLGRYFVVEVYSEKHYPLEPYDLNILPDDHKIILYGRNIHDPYNSPEPFLTVERETGDIFLAINTIAHGMFCLKTAKNDAASLFHLGKALFKKFSSVEILPKGFQVQITQGDIKPKS